MKAISYAHLTPEEEKAGQPSISEQRAAIDAWAKEQRISIVKAYHDDPVTLPRGGPGSTLCSRCGALELIDNVRYGEWVYLVAVSPGRLERPDMGISIREEMEKAGKRIAFVGDQLEIPPQRKKRLVKKPEKVRRALTKPEKLLKGREDGARAGFHQSGPAPYGYTRDYLRSDHGSARRKGPRVVLTIEPTEAEVTRLIFKEYLRRKSMKRVIEFLSEQGIRTRRGKEWSRAGLSWLLKNETYLGRVHFGRIRSRGQHPAIISAITFNKVQKLIKKNNKRGGRGVK